MLGSTAIKLHQTMLLVLQQGWGCGLLTYVYLYMVKGGSRTVLSVKCLNCNVIRLVAKRVDGLERIDFCICVEFASDNLIVFDRNLYGWMEYVLFSWASCSAVCIACHTFYVVGVIIMRNTARLHSSYIWYLCDGLVSTVAAYNLIDIEIGIG